MPDDERQLFEVTIMARVYVYADEFHRQLDTADIDQVLVIPAFNSSPAMVANLQAQTHYCLSPLFTAPTLFADADLIAGRQAGLLTNPFTQDLIVTQRSHVGLDDAGEPVVGVAKEMPYNYGVVIAGNTIGAREAFIWMRQRLAKFGATRQAWYGNQWALRELVGGHYQDPVPRTLTVNTGFHDVDVQVLDCNVWNYTSESATEIFKRKNFIHPKGDRKEIFMKLAKRFGK